MIPLGDIDRRTMRFPAVTALIILANLLIFLAELTLGPPFIRKWVFVPSQIMSVHGALTIVSAMFMHAGWTHILGNMLFLWTFGPQIEDSMGRRRYLAFYLIGGLLAFLAQTAADPASSIPSLGASGAIAAVMAAFLVTYPRDRIRTIVFIFIFVTIAFVPAVILVGFWFLMELVSEVGAIVNRQSGGIAYLAHIGGFAFGLLAARRFERARAAADQHRRELDAV